MDHMGCIFKDLLIFHDFARSRLTGRLHGACLASDGKLLLQFGLPFTWQQHAGAPDLQTFETRFQSLMF